MTIPIHTTKLAEGGNHQLLQLMTLLSPVFPIGSFSYSHGLEQVVHEGFVTSRADMERWLHALLKAGSAWNDTVFLAVAWQEVKNGNNIVELAQLACAMAGSREREMETCMQGQAFLLATAEYGIAVPLTYQRLAYPVAVGIVAAGMGLELAAVAAAYLHAFISNLVQAALRLVPLGQKDGVKLMHAVENDILALSRQTPNLALTDLGSSALMSDICAMRHETLYSRIFRS